MLGAFKELFHRSLTINSQLADNEPAYSRAEDSVKAPSGQSQTLAKDSEERHQNKFSPTYFDEIKRVPDDDEVSTGLQGLPDKALNYAAEKDNFIRTYGHDYGYNGQLAQMRMDEFRRLHEQVYLDYAGAALYSESQIKDSARELMDQLLCNPHSSSSTSASSEALEALRRDTLALLKADGRDYEVVITSGATAALKLVAECFPWTPGVSTLAHPLAVHNSVLGMRGPAIAAGAAVQLVRTSAVAEVASASEDGTAAAEPSGRVVAVVGEPVTRHQSDTTEDCGARWPPGSYAKKPLQGCSICGSGGDGGGSGGGGDGRGGSGGTGGSGGGRSGVGGVKRFESPQSAAYHLLALSVECNFTGDKEPHLKAVVRHVRQFGIDTAAGTGLTTGTVTEAGGDRKGIPKQEDEGCNVAKRRGGGADGGDGSSSGHRWLVLLDAAKACATAPPELSAVPADLVVLSYYKIFGHPTGLGALVVRREVLPLLGARKTYFGGGTVEVAVADRAFHVRRPGPAGLEDGTPPFTSIAAARHGFAFLNRIGGLPAVHRHSRCLARWLAARLAALRHATGAPVCVLYGTWCRAAASAASGLGHRSIVGDLTSFGNPPPPSGGPKEAVPAGGGGGGDDNDNGGLPDHGATLAFNLRRADGSWVGYAEVGRLAALHGLHLRTGCFCNPGACASWLGWSAEDLIRHHSSGHVCWDDNDLADGRPTGAVRVSLGAANSFADVFKLLQLIVTYFMDKSHEDGDGGGIGAGGCDGGGDGGGCDGCDGAGGGGGGGGGVSCVHGTSAMVSQAVASRIVAHTAVAAPPAAVSTARWNTKLTDDETEPSDVRLQLATARPESPQLGYGVPPSPPPSLAHPHLHIQYTAGPQTSSSAAAGGGAAGARIGEGGGSKAAVGRLTCIRLYPVKSCAAQVVEAWPVGPTGLLYDREWALVDDGGKVLTLKQCPRMALIQPVVDLVQGTLIIHPPTATDLAPLELAIPGIYPPTPATELTAAGTGAPLAAASKDGTGDAAGGCRTVTAGADVRQFDAVRLDAGLTLERVQVCGDTVCTDLVNASHSTQGEDRVRNWFARALGAPCRIVQQRTGARKVRRPTGQSAPPRPPTFSAAQPASASACASASVSTSASANKTGSLSPVAATRGTTAADSDILVVGVVGGGGGRTGPAQGAASEELGVRPEGATHEAVVEPAVGFANDGQYLLVSEESMADLRQRMLASRYTAPGATQPSSHTTVQAPKGSPTRDPPSPQHDEDLLTRLRPNLVVAGFQPYTEDHWAAVRVGPLSADVLGTCPRCELLQVDPRVGVRRGSEVLMALAQYRRRGGRMQFGVLLAAAGPGQPLAAAAAAGPGHTMAAGSEFGSGSVLSSESGSGTLHDDAVVSTGLGSGTGAVGVERRGAVVEEEAVTWLRRRFGRLAVVAVGDVVVPMNAAV